MTDILIRQFTDPICTWCWGSEPVLRKLEYKLEGAQTSFIMGGLVADIKDFGNPKASIDQLNNTIHKHWLEAEAKHGMPVTKENFQLFTEENRSSFPQNMAYKAGLFQGEDLAKALLRRIREATTVENLRTNELGVLVGLAEEVGLDAEKFQEDMTNGKAQAEFDKDRQETISYGVNGFPSYSIKAGGKEVLMKGFQVYEAFTIALKDYMDVEVKEKDLGKDPDGVMDFIGRYKRLAPKEISYVFDLNEEEYEDIIGKLKDSGQIELDGPFVRAKA